MAGISLNVPLPIQDRIARARRENLPPGQRDEMEGTMPDVWVKYFQSQADRVSQSPSIQSNTVALTAQSASIAATAMPAGTIRSAMYRLSYYVAIRVPATTSSSLIVTISWTDLGSSRPAPSPAITGNALTTSYRGTEYFRSDASAPILYATTYGSVGATAMQYELVLALELVP